MTPDERADALAAVAVELVGRVRDDEPAAVHRWLRERVAGDEWLGLAVILAAAVPDDRAWSQLTAWTRISAASLAPHGTAAAARRHQYHREPMCADCKRWDRDRKRASRAQVSTDACGQPDPASDAGGGGMRTISGWVQ